MHDYSEFETVADLIVGLMAESCHVENQADEQSLANMKLGIINDEETREVATIERLVPQSDNRLDIVVKPVILNPTQYELIGEILEQVQLPFEQVRPILVTWLNDIKTLKNILDGFNKAGLNLGQACLILGGHNLDEELFDVNFGNILITVKKKENGYFTVVEDYVDGYLDRDMLNVPCDDNFEFEPMKLANALDVNYFEGILSVK